MRRLLPAVAALLAACGDAGLEPGPPAAPGSSPYPAGTVLAVNGLPISMVEVDRVADAVAALYPEHARPHCRRLALTNVVLPLYALRGEDPAARERALEAAEDLAGRLSDGDPVQPERRSGTFVELGLDLFAAVHGRAPGRWSPPLEVLGRFVLVRPAPAPALPLPELATQARALEFDLHEFPYLAPLAPDKTLADRIDRSHLEVVDPDWDELVPGQWKHRMRAHR